MADRREFLRQLALATGGLMVINHLVGCNSKDRWGEILPMRKLGKTGEYVTMLGVGGYHVGWTSERDAQEIIETAMEGGIRFFDTAESYDRGGSETRYGKYLVPKYRDDVFIMTKSTAKDKKTALEHLEGSLKRMKCDYIDLWQVHAIQNRDDVDNRIQNEVLEVFQKAKAEGKVKHLGFTGHQDPFAHQQMFDRTKENDIFETVQMPINVIDSHFHSFIKNAMPEALNRGMGVLAMKTLSDGRFFAKKQMRDRVQWSSDDPIIPNYISIKEALFFAWSLPISVLITGAENKFLLQEKINLAQKFKRLNESDRLVLMEKTHIKAGGQVEYYKKVEEL